MSRFTTTTAILVASTAMHILAVPAHADCLEGGDATNPALTCTATDSGNIDDNRDHLSVTVESDAEIVRAEGRPVQLGGSAQSVDNKGLIESGDDDAIRGKGANLTVHNSGIIRGGDRGIRLQDDADGFTLNNLATGEIFARRQAVRLDNGDALEDAVITNHGLIRSTDGRAVQSRGPGGTVINHGTLRGGEEVVEAREDFTLENRGTIALNGLDWDAVTQTWTNEGATDDEDGVQFSSGRADNHGVILGTDDGIDIDEGVIHNHATGVIVSTGAQDDPLVGGNGIDVDETFEPTVGEDRAAGPLTIVNEGYIEGLRAIGTDVASTSAITIENSGTLRGRSGTAIALSPLQGNSSLTLSGNSRIFGDVIFGGGDDVLTVDGLTSEVLINSIFDGGEGEDTVLFADLALEDVTSSLFDGDLVSLTLNSSNGPISGDFRNFGLWQFDRSDLLTTAELQSAVPQTAVVPLPAGLPLLLASLASLACLRRRSSCA